MAFDQPAVNALFASLISHAQATGLFARVNGHEPKSAPGAQLSCSFWLESVRPEGRVSGLNKTSGVAMISARVYKRATGATAIEDDGIDPAVLTAVSTLLAAYSGDFTLGGTVMNVDLLGQYGTPLSAQAGYVTQDDKQYRVMEITIPVVISDMWNQQAEAS